ncbi:MAG: HAD-IIIA family hydrolase [Chlorobi bacterium]|nr:HAD-IIIA family hydrolase [Chlorobiota bacterium]
MIRAVVFDLDNTLVDFMAMKDRAVEAAVRAMVDAGLPGSFEEVKGRIDEIYRQEGIEYQRVFNTLLTRMLGEVDYKILAAGIIGYRRAREAALVPYPHVHLTLYELAKRGYKLGIVSDAPQLEAWLRLCYLQLHHVFDAVVTFEDSGVRKPSPEPFRKILSLLGVEPEHSLMVGDWADRDIVGAAKVGMKTAFARYGDTFETEQANADYELTDIRQLLDILPGPSDDEDGAQ